MSAKGCSGKSRSGRILSILLVTVFTCLLLAGCNKTEGAGGSGSSTSSARAKTDILNVGTGSVGGTDNVVVEAISSVVNSNTDIRTSTVTTAGGAEILYLLESGEIQAGYAGTIDVINALNGADVFDHKIDQSHMLQCFGFVTWDLPIVVLADSDIETYEDLAGKRVGLSPVGSSTASVLMAVFDAYGLTDKIRIDNFTWNEGYTALKDGRLDAFVGSWSNGAPISGLLELKATDGIRLLDMDPAVAEAIHEMNAGLGGGYLTHAEEDSIPEGVQILCPTNSGLIVADASVSEDDMYKYTKAVLDNLETLKATSTYFNGFEEVCTGVCIESVPFHPGAAKALKEAGYWKDSFIIYGE